MQIIKKRFKYFILIPGAAALAIVFLWHSLTKAPPVVEDYEPISRAAVIKPDYSDTVIPPNIAPLNFVIAESGAEYLIKIYSVSGESINIFSRTGTIEIPQRRWRRLLNANRGKELFFDVYVRNQGGSWNRYEKITNVIAREDIDSYLVYRFMNPIFNWWKDIGIYQRNLENYDKSLVLHGNSFNNGCINCHTFLNNDTEFMTVGVRSPSYGGSLLLACAGKVDKIGTKWGYTAWHPSGRLAAYSMNKVQQFFHKTTLEIRDVVDLDSAICYYDLNSQKIKTIPSISDKDRLESYPTWSPDGKYLYFCSAPILWQDRNTVPPRHYDQVKYDLRRISYNVNNDEWGRPETVLSADKTGLSVLLPRISPDGRFLVFCMCRYGCFPIYQPSSDLYLMDLETGKYDKLAINSEFSESWHSFSSNGRWLAFSSKAGTGLFTRTYFSYIDESGKAYKPFILPQKDPAYYDSLLQTYSVPELVKNPVKVSRYALTRAVRRPKMIEVDIPITGATVGAETTEPWQQGRE